MLSFDRLMHGNGRHAGRVSRAIELGVSCLVGQSEVYRLACRGARGIGFRSFFRGVFPTLWGKGHLDIHEYIDGFLM